MGADVSSSRTPLSVSGESQFFTYSLTKIDIHALDHSNPPESHSSGAPRCARWHRRPCGICPVLLLQGEQCSVLSPQGCSGLLRAQVCGPAVRDLCSVRDSGGSARGADPSPLTCEVLLGGRRPRPHAACPLAPAGLAAATVLLPAVLCPGPVRARLGLSPGTGPSCLLSGAAVCLHGCGNNCFCPPPPPGIARGRLSSLPAARWAVVSPWSDGRAEPHVTAAWDAVTRTCAASPRFLLAPRVSCFVLACHQHSEHFPLCPF